MIVYSQSEEDYLETLYIIQQEGRVTRVKDVAEALDVKMPSVVSAIRSLADKGLVTQERYSHIELTEMGESIAKDVYARHKILYAFLHEILGLESKIADEDACRIEHHLSPETRERLLRIVEFTRSCKKDEVYFLKRFTRFLSTGKMPEACRGCAK